jgi:voltage-gated potassium channel
MQNEKGKMQNHEMLLRLEYSHRCGFSFLIFNFAFFHLAPRLQLLPCMKPSEYSHRRMGRVRWNLLRDWEERLEMPLLVLGFVWLALLMAEFLGHSNRVLEWISTGIWIVFWLDFGLRFWLAPAKVEYLKRNWLTLLSLLVPALRLLRFARVIRLLRLARVSRGLRLFRLMTSLNRGMKALGKTLGRRGFGYVAALTLIVTFAGAAGMVALEENRFSSYADALWWTAMLMTTLGSETWPQTGEGRILCFALALYAFTVFGYVTATLATFFVGRDAENQDAEIASNEDIQALRREIRELRAEIRVLTSAPRSDS